MWKKVWLTYVCIIIIVFIFSTGLTTLLAGLPSIKELIITIIALTSCALFGAIVGWTVIKFIER